MGNKYSDLPFGPGGENIILVQQELSIGERRDLFLANDDLLSEMFNKAVNLEGLVHVGSIHCYNYEDSPGKPIGLGPNCNGTITIKVAGEEKWAGGHRTITQIICSNASCGMKLVSQLTIPEISNIMFHLMIKQMMPSLATCNYVDCSATEETINLTLESAEKIRAFGLISLSSRILYGLVQNGYFSNCEEFSLGFTLMPGMNTINGCDGFDKWFRFLITKKFEQLKKQHQASMAGLLGPKPRTKS